MSYDASGDDPADAGVPADARSVIGRLPLLVGLVLAAQVVALAAVAAGAAAVGVVVQGVAVVAAVGVLWLVRAAGP